MAGRCWGLFLLPAAVAQLTATDFVKYYNYNGGLAVAGTVTVTTDGTSQTLDYSLSGVDLYAAPVRTRIRPIRAASTFTRARRAQMTRAAIGTMMKVSRKTRGRPSRTSA